MTSWTPLVPFLAYTFPLHFTLFISPFRFTKFIIFLPSLYLKIQLHVFTILIKSITTFPSPQCYHGDLSFPHLISFQPQKCVCSPLSWIVIFSFTVHCWWPFAFFSTFPKHRLHYGLYVTYRVNSKYRRTPDRLLIIKYREKYFRKLEI